MPNLVQLACMFQAAGTDCLVVDREQCVHPPDTLTLGSRLADVIALTRCGGDATEPLHLRRDDEWVRAEPVMQDGEHWLVALLPRTAQHIVHQATLLQHRRDALQDLAASTAREMNDAMTIVQGRLELLMAVGMERPDSALRHASIALEHSERITNALHNLRLVGSGGLLRFQSMDVAEQVRRALGASVDDLSVVQVEVPPGTVRIVGHEAAVQGVLTGIFRAVMGEEGGAVRVLRAGHEVSIAVSSKASRHTDLDSLPLGIVTALLEALGGRLHFKPAEIVLCMPSELEERGLLPHDKVVLAIGQPAFTSAIRTFLEPDTAVRVSRSLEAADLQADDLYAVVTELLLPGASGMAAVERVASERPGVRTLLVTHDPLDALPERIRSLSGPMDRVRLIRALTGVD